MGKKSRVRHEPPEFLAAWRKSLGLSRQAVANRMGTILPAGAPDIDQATIAKWETGETALRLEDLKLLASAYGVTPDRLLFEPGDAKTPELFRRAFNVLQHANEADIERWLGLGESLTRPQRPEV